MNRLIDFVIFGVLSVLIMWTGYDFFVEARSIEYLTEKPIRLLYIIGFAVLAGIYLGLFFSEPKRSKAKDRLP